jgi:CRISPR/Cas system-associated exonuclease Cas4 (RecB family)
MRTKEEIREEYRKKIIEYAQKKDDEYNTRPDGTTRDRSTSVTVTDMCVWTTYCPRQIFYDKTARRPPLPESLMRFQIGNVVHDIPLWDNEDELKNGYEQGFEWDGIKCRMDEIHYKDGIIIDKKTVASLPLKVKPYVERQLNIYKLIAEENSKRPIKINQLFVINIAVVNGKIQVQEVPIWPREQTLDFINKTRNEIIMHVKNGIPPEVTYGSKGWMCDSCQYIDFCKIDKSFVREDFKENKEEKEEINKNENKSQVKISVKKGK